ncbi:MAG: hypothetical protein MR210_00565 [Erysipelotrichaceae bacterium]|nr:hypothetical protein [Erysipelotrichaceae bacterium]MDY5251215.1 hypothetical protein [Erysipelotrichaceae bacterium]
MKTKIILLAFILLFTTTGCSTNEEFNYKFNNSISIKKDEINTLINSPESMFDINDHSVSFHYEAVCFYDEYLNLDVEGNETILYYTEEKINESSQSQLPYDSFYVGYFKTLEEAVYFAETNLDGVNNYILSNSENLSDEDVEHDYRIDEICSLEKAGYVVSFGLLDTYMSQSKFDLIKNKTFQESLELAIKNDKILNNLNVFIIFDIYLGNIDYMHFEIVPLST